jgi:hypothetical protein
MPTVIAVVTIAVVKLPAIPAAVAPKPSEVKNDVKSGVKIGSRRAIG